MNTLIVYLSKHIHCMVEISFGCWLVPVLPPHMQWLLRGDQIESRLINRAGRELKVRLFLHFFFSKRSCSLLTDFKYDALFWCAMRTCRNNLSIPANLNQRGTFLKFFFAGYWELGGIQRHPRKSSFFAILWGVISYMCSIKKSNFS